MPNYQQTSVAGDCWTRAYRIEMDNPYGENQQAKIKFLEEKLCNFSDGTVISQVITVTKLEELVEEFLTLENTNTEFPLFDKNGNSLNRSVSYNDVYVILQSLYMFLAEKRDIKYAAALEEERLRIEENARNAQ